MLSVRDSSNISKQNVSDFAGKKRQTSAHNFDVGGRYLAGKYFTHLFRPRGHNKSLPFEEGNDGARAIRGSQMVAFRAQLGRKVSGRERV